MTPFTIRNQWALGDTVCLSALVRDLRLTYPDQYRIALSGSYESYWENNPYGHHIKGGAHEGRLVDVEYVEGIKAASHGKKVHFLSWFHRDFSAKTGIAVPVTLPKGDIHLSKSERVDRRYPFRYWLIAAGGKRDLTAKVWYAHRYQQVIDILLGFGIRCVQVGSDASRHFNPALTNCESAVGKTPSIRSLFSLVYHADGVICPVTSFMHIAAAFDKPCVVVAGGREEPWWEAYVPESFASEPSCKPVKVPHRFLHTVGLLDCGCDNLRRGCWKHRTVPIEQADISNATQYARLCRKPVRGIQPVPECLSMITTEMVVEAVLSYYLDGTLAPPQKQEGTTMWPAISTQGTSVPLSDGRVATVRVSLNMSSNETVETPIETVKETPQSWIEVPVPFVGLPKEFKKPSPEDPALAVLDHPYIGGKVTIFVLSYGSHVGLLRRCVDSILASVPAHRMDLRVGLNQPEKPMLDYMTGFNKTIVSKLYVDPNDHDSLNAARKYDMMRRMFWDQAHPIGTNYVVWFDDDSHVVDKRWLAVLGRAIVDNHGANCRLYGPKYIHDLVRNRPKALANNKDYDPAAWFKSATWWKDAPFHAANGTRVSPNGSEIVFASGGFWALGTEAIRKGDIPDKRLRHNGGDITIGLQVHQAGFRILNFSANKTPIRWSDAPRRGFSETFPWHRVPCTS